MNDPMRRMAAAFKLEFDTVRDLEHKGFRAFWISGITLAIGVVLTMLAITAPIGVPLIIIGGVAFLCAMVWVTLQSKERTRKIFCPYCATSNDVFESRSQFDCDICERPIEIGDDGEPVAVALHEERD